MKVVLAGGSGFLGRHVQQALLNRGDEVVVLSRQPEPDGLPADVTWHVWDATTLGPWVEALRGADAIVNLVGRSVDCRKTPHNKQVILQSRVDSVRVLGEAMRRLMQEDTAGNPPTDAFGDQAAKDAGQTNKVGCQEENARAAGSNGVASVPSFRGRGPGVVPGVVVQMGTAHIHGDPVPVDTVVDETSPVGEGFAPEVGVAWEQAFDEALLPGQRGVVLRTSFVLGQDGGALPKMAAFAKWGMGGRMGDGKQWISWIHIADFCHQVLMAIDDATVQGVYLVTAPEPVTNAVFMAALRKACRRPWSPPVPGLAVRLASCTVMDTDPELALLGRRVVPKRWEEEGRPPCRFPDLESALADLLG